MTIKLPNKELTQRGLTTNGLKPTLVELLEKVHGSPFGSEAVDSWAMQKHRICELVEALS